jgi:hypothetical protein
MMEYVIGFSTTKKIPIYTDLSKMINLEPRIEKLCISEEMGNLIMLDSYNDEELSILEGVIRRGLTFQVLPNKITDIIPCSKKVIISDLDAIIPICHEGQNRSQVMFIVANYIKKIVSCNVYRPHGAMGGYDPYQAYKDLTEDNVYGYILNEDQHISEPGEWLHRNFIRAFGIKKQKKILKEKYDELKIKLNPDKAYLTPRHLEKLSIDRIKMRTEFDKTLYNPHFLNSLHKPYGKTILLCFGNSMKIFIKRLFETSLIGNLNDIHIVLIPWGDTIAHVPQFIINDLSKDDITRDKASIAAHIYTFKKYSSIFAIKP